MIQMQSHTMTGKELKIIESEAYRYLGYANVVPNEQVKGLVTECAQKMCEVAMPKSMYAVYEIKREEGYLDLGFARVKSNSLEKNLKDCEKVILMAATIGPRPDLLIQKYSKMDPLKGVVMQAVGAMLIESYCDEQNEALCRQMQEQGYGLHPRFSPGYGDFALAHQKDVFRVLDCNRTLGLTLMDSMIMAPSKSVTAVIGMEKGMNMQHGRKRCSFCGNTACEFRKMN